MKLLWKLISSILAYVLNAILVTALIALPIISFVTDHTDPGKLVELLTSSGLFTQAEQPVAFHSGILLANGAVPDEANASTLLEQLRGLVGSGIIDIDQLMDELDVPASAEINRERLLRDLTESKATQALLSTYAEDVFSAATGSGSASSLTPETVGDILSPHIEELATIVQNNLPQDLQIDKDALTGAIDKVASTALPSFIEALPSAAEIANTLTSHEVFSFIVRGLDMISSGQLRLITIGAIVILALLIFLLRLPMFAGLRRVGISSLFSAVVIGAIGYLLQAKPLLLSLEKALHEVSVWVMPLLATVSSTFVSFAIVYGIAGGILIVSYGILIALRER